MSPARPGRVFGYGREFPWALLILGHNHKAGSLTLPQSPVPEDATTKLFSEPLSSSHTLAWPQASVSPGSLCCCSSPGQPLFQFRSLYGPALCFPGQRSVIALWSNTSSVLGMGAVTQGTLHDLAGTGWPRAPWQILSQEPPSPALQDSAWRIYLHYPSGAATLRGFWKLSLS